MVNIPPPAHGHQDLHPGTTQQSAQSPHRTQFYSMSSDSPPYSLPSTVHVSTHPCLRAKLSQLRSKDASPRDAKVLVHEIALIIGCEALASTLKTTSSGTHETPLGYPYITETISPHVVLVPILRSGLGMLEAIQTLLPDPVPVHHLGLFREPTTLAPVEYYNNLPREISGRSGPSSIPEIAIIIDPVIATGGTAVAAIQTLLEWGVRKVVVICVLGSVGGVVKAAGEGSDGNVEIWVGGLDAECDARGMIRPGLGDVGDRLFLTSGK